MKRFFIVAVVLMALLPSSVFAANIYTGAYATAPTKLYQQMAADMQTYLRTVVGSTDASGTWTPGMSITVVPLDSATPTTVIGNANTDLINGFSTTLSISISSATATICPTLPAGTRKFLATCDVDCNFGGSAITSDTSQIYIPANVPAWSFKVATTTPAIYFRARSTSGTIYVYPCVEP